MADDKFKCFVHDLGFDDLDDFREHIANEVHTHTGVSLCNQCGISTEYEFTGKLAKGKYPALCKDCKSALVEGLK
ncbi:hypothetical protein LCGC14_1195070 [marine sediment metagenome]|uniref:Uncharacterized protein n=1 Tax=marine sediment metagenome TaxID=412755 RepID=A0A0F9P136_9ZZZZ